MDLLTDVLLLVLILVLVEVLASDAVRIRIARRVELLRIRCGRRLPVGSYRLEADTTIGIRFGVDDTTLILRLPLPDPVIGRVIEYTGATDSSTTFLVGGEAVNPDALLEAYDESLGPLEIRVWEAGRIAELAIAADVHRSEAPTRQDRRRTLDLASEHSRSCAMLRWWPI